jgi:prepilin-type N-terminal cleavage/methylation domain-containing protein
MKKPQKVNKKAKAFTLIELMVAIGLMLIIFTVALPNYRSYQRSKVLDKAYQDMVADIRLAQEYAISGNKPTACGSDILQGYEVYYASGFRYQIRAVCGGNYVYVKTVDLNDVTQSSFNPIGFKVLGEGTNISAGATRTITLTQSNTGNTKTIYVESGGEIH